VRLRTGGERLQPDAHRPRRTLKNLFQEASVPPWERERLPLLFCGKDLVWAPLLGVDAGYRAAKNGAGIVPEWRPSAA
jgi:tRNA(Ile)-lysidine synthase